MAKKPKPTRRTPVKVPDPLPDSAALLADLRGLIESARAGVAQAVYSAQVVLLWRVGQRILSDILKRKRATYGGQIVATVARQLTADYGRGFAEKCLRRMIQFAVAFPDPEIVVALSRQLSWSHFVEIIPLKTDLHREFYAEMCRVERWGVRTLRDKIGGMLFERTALSREAQRSWPSSARRTSSRRTWSFAIRISWTFSGWPTPIAKRTWRPRSCARWNGSSSSSGPGSRSWPGSSGLPLITETTISIYCFFIASCAGSSSYN